MSKQFLHIPSLLKAEEILAVEQAIAGASFADGKLTASMAAREVKNNLQIDKHDESLTIVQNIVSNALKTSPLFNIAALPKNIYPALVSKYTSGKYYGWHVDSPIMGDPPIRTDLAMTIFLSDPSTYEGGELLIQTGNQIASFKPAKGDAVL